MLYICATPIGNLDDITIRVVNALSMVDIVAAEDTRHTLKLLNHLNIKKQMISFHEFSDHLKLKRITDSLSQGKNIALVSDAGMPCISDPGYVLVRECIKNDIPFTVLPGASAFTTALVHSGISSDKFKFCGFIPAKKSDMARFFKEIEYDRSTLIFYVSPHKILKTLEYMLTALGDRSIAVARELTKKFEEVQRFTISDAVNHYQSNEPRGEFVLVVEGCKVKQEIVLDFDVEMDSYIAQGITKKEAIKLISERSCVPKRDVYNHFINK